MFTWSLSVFGWIAVASLVAGIGWTVGCWLAGRLLAGRRPQG